jgi:hypothetical protein
MGMEQADKASVEGGASHKIYNVDVQHSAVILTSGFKPITDTVLQNHQWWISVCSLQKQNCILGTFLEVSHGYVYALQYLLLLQRSIYILFCCMDGNNWMCSLLVFCQKYVRADGSSSQPGKKVHRGVFDQWSNLII